MASAVTHFDIYAEEPTKLAEFYRSLFDWQIEQAPGIDYWRIQTGATDSEAIRGGLLYRPIPASAHGAVRASNAVLASGACRSGLLVR